MMWRKTTRRKFIQTAGLVAGATAFGCGSGGPGDSPPPPQPPPPEPPPPEPPVPVPPPGADLRVRQDVSSLGANDPIIQALRQGVEAMKARAEADPTSWAAQANIHLNFCPHGNWFFLPWHRAYLDYFERICRAASGNPDFALPYWNWTTARQIPAVFFQGTLDDPSRQAGPGDRASAEFVGQPVINHIMATSDFVTFASGVATQQRQGVANGILEGQPHNYIHNFVGGNMRTFLSPLDPIFWLHHCNVDRLWAMWNERHANTSDPRWLDFAFDANFVDPDGNSVNTTVRDQLSTEALGYRYDTQSEAVTVLQPRALRTASESVVAANDRPATVSSLNIAVETDADMQRRLREVAEASTAGGTLQLAIRGVIPRDEPVAVRVFVNAGEVVRADTPIDHPSYVGSFTFFEHGTHHTEERDFLFNAADTVRGLIRDGRMEEGEPVDVQIIVVPIRQEAGLSLEDVEVAPTQVGLAFIAD